MLKNPLLIFSLILLSGLNPLYSQIIQVDVTKSQRHYKYGSHSYQEVLKYHDGVEPKKKINCHYIFNLNDKTSTFWSESANVEPIILPLDDFKKNRNKYVIQYTSIGDIDSSFTYPITIYLDTKKETMYYTKYDPYLDRSFVTPCKSKITLKYNESQ